MLEQEPTEMAGQNNYQYLVQNKYFYQIITIFLLLINFERTNIYFFLFITCSISVEDCIRFSLHIVKTTKLEKNNNQGNQNIHNTKKIS